jgi:hypothetical protein
MWIFDFIRSAHVDVGAEAKVHRPHDVLVFALDAANDGLRVDADRRLGRAHIGVVVAVGQQVVAQDARVGAAVDLRHPPVFDRERDR